MTLPPSASESPGEEQMKTRTSPIRLLFHVLVISSVGLLGVIGYIGKSTLHPTVRGFFCGDRSISYPYRSNTVNYSTVLLWGNGLLLAALVCTEFRGHIKRKLDGSDSRPFYRLFAIFEKRKLVILPPFSCFVHFGAVAALGFVINLWAVSAIKLTLGQLRPHFLAVCKPTLNYSSTSLLTACATGEFISPSAYHCQKPETDPEMRDARLSFPSGHTSAAFYYAAFLTIYLHARLAVHRKSRMPLFVILYAAMFISAALVGVSRILDNKHHPVDVMAGGLIGVGIAASVLYCSKHLFSQRSGADASASSQEATATQSKLEQGVTRTNDEGISVDGNSF